MPSQINALLVNFAVKIKDSKGKESEIKHIMAATGFDLGEEATIEVPEDDRIAGISNGRRKVGQLTMKYRLIAGSMGGDGTHKYFTDWWNAREGENRDVKIYWLQRDRKTEIFHWTFEDCEFIGFKGEDQEYASPKVGVMEMKFAPYDIKHDISNAGKLYKV